MRSSQLARVALAGALALAGCGADEPPAASEIGAIDACALLTAAEIEEATGITPGAPQDAGFEGSVPLCNWPTADGSDPAFLTVLVAPSGNYGSYADALVKWQESASETGYDLDPADYEEVEGAGRVNAWMPEAGMLQAHRGNRMVQVSARVAPGRDRLQASIALTGHALTRLD